MIKSNSVKKHKLLKLCMAFLFPFSLFGGLALTTVNQNAYADYVAQYEESVTVTNSSFTQGSIASASNSLTGWTAIETYSKASGMIVDVGSGTNSDDSENSTFSRYQSTYMLQENPRANGSDTRILMINSKASSSQSNVLAQKGYRSNSITLNANSFYRFKVSVKTATNGDDSVNASVYLSGLKDANGEAVNVGYENITTSVWKEFFVFVATGNKTQTVTLDLYLGSANGQSSYGAVFFDDVNVTKLSNNAFMSACLEKGYDGNDDYKTYNTNTTRILVDALKEEAATVDTTGYNFDFEDPIESDTNTLGESWSVINKSKGHAVVADIKNMQVADFKNLTGYDYVGTDLSYGNNQALILYTDDNGYVGVKSKGLEINAHEIYKVTMNVKVAQITSGSFYLKVQENDKIYTLYPEILSSDSNAGNYYALQNAKTSGITSNTTNNFTNDYRTVTFFIKGHSLYNTEVDLELWLGDDSTQAKGCVVVDNITVEYSYYEAFNSASDKLELKSFSSSPASIKNGYFNATENTDADGLYPVKATDWTVEYENERNNVSGVIYLYDAETYNQMYKLNGYDWAGIYPGSPAASNTTTPNNVYMMFNKSNSYQSIKSTSYTLNADGYYKLSFDYYTQDISGLNDAKLKIEVVDENGITIYSKTDLASMTTWKNMQILFHTAPTISHNITIKVSLGDQDNACGGIAYVDNFVIEDAEENDFVAANFKANLSNYYLDLNQENLSREITSSPAYKLEVASIYNSSYTNKDDCAVGGTVNGQDNPYMEINEELQLEQGNYLVLNTKVASKATLTSVYELNLEAGKYYKLTFDLATIFSKEDTDKHEFGATVGLKGFNENQYLVTNSDLNSYTIYFKCETATKSAIVFTLNSNNDDAVGTALLTNIDFAAVEESEYTNIQLSPSLNKSIFTSKQTSSTETDEDESQDEDDSSKDSQTNNGGNTWLLIPSIITAVAVVVGVIGWAFRHVKIKKIEKIKTEDYDRKLAVNHDSVLKEAQKRRDKEVETLVATKKSLEQETVKLENDHKEFLKQKQAESNGKLTKEMEKAFKSYNSQKHALNAKIDILNEKIANASTAEYLLSIEKKVLDEEEDKLAKQRKELKKNSKNAK